MALKAKTQTTLVFYLLVFVAILFLFSCKSEQLVTIEKTPNVEFVKTIGGSNNDFARSVISTNDGGYIIAGSSQSNDGDIVKNNIDFDYLVLKYDQENNLQWQKTFGGTKDDRCEKIIQTLDNGYAIIGYNRSSDIDASSNNGFQDIWIIKLDFQGNISWQKSFGFSGADQGFSLIQTVDGGYFIAGILDVTASGGLGNKISALNKHAGGDFWALKLDASGNLQWRNYFGGTNTDTCYDAVETNDGYIMVGSSDSVDVDIKNNKGSYDFWLVKIDKEGNLLWQRSLGGNEIETSYDILSVNDGNFILVGDTRSSDQDVSNQNGGADIWVVKIDTNGTILWEQNFGGSSFDAAREIINLQDGGYAIAGSSRSSDIDVTENKGQNDVWVVKIDGNGKLLWQKSIGGSEIDFAYGITQLKDNSLIIVGDSNSSDNDILENKGFTDALIIKINEE